MADLWNEFPADTGQLAGAVSRHVAVDAPLVPRHVGPVMDAHLEHPTARPKPCRDSYAWLLLKHLVQLALVASVLMFVLYGDNAPMLSFSYLGTALLLMVTIVLADRQRFGDRDPAFEIVEFVAPPLRAAAPAPAVRQDALVPMVELMQAVLPERVNVT